MTEQQSVTNQQNQMRLEQKRRNGDPGDVRDDDRKQGNEPNDSEYCLLTYMQTKSGRLAIKRNEEYHQVVALYTTSASFAIPNTSRRLGFLGGTFVLRNEHQRRNQ